MSILSGKNILLGVSAGIAAYKSAFLVREFIQGFILYKTFKTLHESALLLIFPLLEILLLSVQACLFITNIVSKPKSWD